MTQVSIIVLTYNPDNDKLRRTLEAAIAQRDINVEIIISDDGSAQKDFSFLPEFFAAHGFTSYRLVENPENKGTVYNCYAGIQAASGEYVFLTSPGDILFDSHTIADFYSFAKAQNASLCFGNSVYYCVDAGKVRLTAQHGAPLDPLRYLPHTDIKTQKAAFFGGDWIIGAAYFRSRKFALELFQKLLDVSIYMEDTPSTMLALAQGVKLNYLDRNIVWYEHGTGVSTGASEKWKQRLNQDLRNSLDMIYKNHAKDPWVHLARINISAENKAKRLLSKLFFHPLLTLSVLKAKGSQRPKPIQCAPADIERLNQLLANKPII